MKHSSTYAVTWIGANQGVYTNALDKNEMNEFLREYCRDQEVMMPSMIRYSTFFNEFPKLKEGWIQKREMARFLK